MSCFKNAVSIRTQKCLVRNSVIYFLYQIVVAEDLFLE